MILLGPPGSGKGTIASLLKEECGLVHISTGDIFRSNIKNETELGKEAQSYMEKGDLVPDELTIRMVRSRLNEEDAKSGFILDGFPRTIEQAEALEQILSENGFTLDLALNVIVPHDIIMQRLAGRRVCSQCGATYNVYFQPTKVESVCDACGGEVIQRADDNEATIENRLSTYEEKTAPLIQFYKEKEILMNLDNSGSLDDSWNVLKAKLQND